jgi:hypothetical protein
MLDDEQGLSRPAAFYVGAKLAHKRFWRIKPVVCMLFEEMPKPLYSVSSGISELKHMELVVSMLATLHARWWQKPKKPPIEWVSHPSKDNFGIQLNAFIYAAKSGTGALVRCRRRAQRDPSTGRSACRPLPLQPNLLSLTRPRRHPHAGTTAPLLPGDVCARARVGAADQAPPQLPREAALHGAADAVPRRRPPRQHLL